MALTALVTAILTGLGTVAGSNLEIVLRLGLASSETGWNMGFTNARRGYEYTIQKLDSWGGFVVGKLQMMIWGHRVTCVCSQALDAYLCASI
jgi:hypothetical protein